MEETELRERLAYLADHTSPSPRDPETLVRTVTGRLRDRRRKERIIAALAAVVVVVIAFVAGPAVRSLTSQDVSPAGPSPSTGVYTTPTRGDLAADSVFVERVRRLPWTTGPTGADILEPPLDARHVVFAGDSSQARWALVAGADPRAPFPPDEDGDGRRDLDQLDSVVIAWFTGPLDAAPEEMTVYGEPRVVDADEPTAVLSPTEPYPGPFQHYAVVVGAPGDRIEESWSRQFTSDGEIFREYDPVDTVEGVHAGEGGQVDASINLAQRYRVLRGDTEFAVVPQTEPAPDFVPPRIDLVRLRPSPPPAPGDAAVTAAIDELISHIGVWAEIYQFSALWVGDLPSPPAGSARVTVLSAEYDEWGVYLTAAVGRDSGGGVSAGTCGSEIRPFGTPVDDLVVVLRCGADGGPGDASTDSLVVVAPPGAATARALDTDGRLLAEYPLTDGVAVVPVPPGLASVAVIDAAGETVDERAPMAEVDFGD
jgi:hypothetical protein